jgi:ketosteroid isomerase-like protein
VKTAKQLQQEIYQAYADGDMELMFSYFSEDCIVREAPGLPFGGEWVGHDGMRSMFATMAEHFEMEATLLDVYEASPSTVIMHSLFRMTSKHGETVDMPVLEIFNCRDDHVFEAIPFYWDAARLAEMAAGPTSG